MNLSLYQNGGFILKKNRRIYALLLGTALLFSLGACSEDEKQVTNKKMPTFSTEEATKTIEEQSQGDASNADFYLHSMEETEKQIALHVIVEDVYSETDLVTFSKGMEYDLRQLNETNKEVLLYIYETADMVSKKTPYYVYEKNNLYKQSRK